LIIQERAVAAAPRLSSATISSSPAPLAAMARAAVTKLPAATRERHRVASALQPASAVSTCRINRSIATRSPLCRAAATPALMALHVCAEAALVDR
jgi:hypothetical protein